MAIIFELVVNFGTNEAAVARAGEAVAALGHVAVRGVRVPLGSPSITRLRRPPNDYIEYAVHPRGIGSAGPGPTPDLDPRSLTAEELTSVGTALYDLLRAFDSYRVAAVGWDPEPLVDVEELEADCRAGHPPSYAGLVLADDLHERWDLGPEWASFAPG